MNTQDPTASTSVHEVGQQAPADSGAAEPTLFDLPPQPMLSPAAAASPPPLPDAAMSVEQILDQAEEPSDSPPVASSSTAASMTVLATAAPAVCAAEPLVPQITAVPPEDGGSGIWTIPLLCLGIGIIACCLLIPQADKNRRLAYQREGLKRELQHVQEQIAINDKFLQSLSGDPIVAERLAQRQLRMVRSGTSVLNPTLSLDPQDTSPFMLVNLAPPAPLPPYHPIGGRWSALCRSPQSRLYLMGLGLLAVASGLVLGGHNRADSLE